MNRRPEILIAALMGFSAATATAETKSSPTRIDVFMTHTLPVSGSIELRREIPDLDINLHRIDGLETIKARMNNGLPGDRRAAEKIALKRLQSFGVEERELLQNAADGLVIAWQYKVHRYPAVVIDRRWVIYGVTDLRHAYALYNARLANTGS